MNQELPKFTIWWKRWGDPITAIAIIFFIIFSVRTMIGERELKQEIANTCGWAEEDYRCYCEKGKVTLWEDDFKLGKLNLTASVNDTLGK